MPRSPTGPTCPTTMGKGLPWWNHPPFDPFESLIMMVQLVVLGS